MVPSPVQDLRQHETMHPFTGSAPTRRAGARRPVARQAEGTFPPLPPRATRSGHGRRPRPTRDHGWLLRTPAPELPPAAAFRYADRARPPHTPSDELRRKITRHFERACAWWAAPPGPDDLARAVTRTIAGPDDGIVEAWIAEARPGLWIRAWTEGLYSLEDLVAAAVRTRLDHRLFRHVIAPYGYVGPEFRSRLRAQKPSRLMVSTDGD